MEDLIFIALEHEAPKMAKWDNVFFTGVGKINAAMTAAKYIERYRPRRVWNFGTAGGIKLDPGIYEFKNFVERDKGKCPESVEIMLPKDPQTISMGLGYTLSTGDNFVTDPNLEIPAHAVDMEGFAIAKICQEHKIEFKCFKYITDSADDSADTNWLENVQKGEDFFIKVYEGKQ